MRSILLLVLLLMFAGCKKSEPRAPDDLLSRVKAGLAAREKKVVSFQYEGETRQADQSAGFAFAFRAPRKMRAEFTATGLTFVFDGKHFKQWDPRSRTLLEVDLEKAAPEAVTLFLHQSFAPFVPEGWRTPLLAGRLQARESGAGEVEVTAAIGEGADAVEVAYTFARPAFDFAGKRVRGGGSVQVKEKHCEQALGLCFPTRVEELAGDAPAATTVLTNVVVNGPLAPEVFEIEAPADAKVETRTLEQLSAR